MRDALMQVDHERRNERLVHSVNLASEAISDNIRYGLKHLQSTMDQQLRTLNYRISDFSGQLSGIASAASEQSRTMNRTLGELSSSNAAQRALLEKIGTSSDRMAKDIKVMREISDGTYIY